jgi:ferritin-like metal-binding protein YciE
MSTSKKKDKAASGERSSQSNHSSEFQAQEKRSSINDKLILYLNEALSMENAVMERLESRIIQTLLPDVKSLLYYHLQVTNKQQDRLIQLISELGGESTEEKAQLPMLSPPGSIADDLWLNMTIVEAELWAAEEDQLVEYAEIALYESLLLLAHKAALGNAITVAIQNLDEERTMVNWIRANNEIFIKKLSPEAFTPVITTEGTHLE